MKKVLAVLAVTTAFVAPQLIPMAERVAFAQDDQPKKVKKETKKPVKKVVKKAKKDDSHH